MTGLPEAIKAVFSDDQVDCVAAVSYASSDGFSLEMFSGLFKEISQHYQKPLALWIYSAKQDVVLKWARHFDSIGIPVCT